MKKEIIRILLCITISVALSGCYGSNELKQYIDETLLTLVDGESGKTEVVMTETGDVESEDTTALITEEDAGTRNTTAATTEEEISTENIQRLEEEAEQLKSEWKQAYQNRISELLATEYADTIYALLLDMDQDGIPELLTGSMDESDIYTYAEGQLIALGYQYGYIPADFYYQEGMLISTDCGYDVLSGLFLNVTRKEGGQLVHVASYGFRWDENMNPQVTDYLDSESGAMVSYEEAIEDLKSMGIYVAYEPNSNDNMSCLLYSVECHPGTKELEPDRGAERIEERIRFW